MFKEKRLAFFGSAARNGNRFTVYDSYHVRLKTIFIRLGSHVTLNQIGGYPERSRRVSQNAPNVVILGVFWILPQDMVYYRKEIP